MRNETVDAKRVAPASAGREFYLQLHTVDPAGLRCALANASVMKKFTLMIALAAFTICSCSEKSSRLPIGDDPFWISEDKARELCEDFLLRQGYTNAQIVGETAMSGKCWYTFATNGKAAPLKVTVDRKTKVVGYGDWKR